MKHIAVFCSAYNLEEKYTIPAKRFAQLLVENGYNLVWGGSNTGLMKQFWQNRTHFLQFLDPVILPI